MNLIEKAQELFSFKRENILSLTSFVVGGCEAGNVYNVFFETVSDKYYYQTIDLDDFGLSQKFVIDWTTPRIAELIEQIDKGNKTIGRYHLSRKGVLVEDKFFSWKDTQLIFDGVNSILKNKIKGLTYSIDNTEDFIGFLIVCLFNPSPTKQVKRAIARWNDIDLDLMELEKHKIEGMLRHASKQKLFFEQLCRNHFNEAIRIIEAKQSSDFSNQAVQPLEQLYVYSESKCSSIYSLTTYYPVRNANNETFNILKLKDKDPYFCQKYAKKIANFINNNRLEDHEIVVTPSSSQGFPENGISLVAKYLESHFFINWHLAKREIPIAPAHISNQRDIEKHIETISITECNLENRQFLVIDDIKSTGNTLHALEKLLYQHNASDVVLLAVAETHL